LDCVFLISLITRFDVEWACEGVTIICVGVCTCAWRRVNLARTVEEQADAFWRFCDRHRRVLNVFVRNNPELLKGSLYALVRHPQKILDFENKTMYFRAELKRQYALSQQRRRHPTGGLRLNVRRSNVFADSVHAFKRAPADQVKGRLHVQFQGEEGIDAGGVTRDWFSVMGREIFNAQYALFSPSAINPNVFQPNPFSDLNPDHLAFFEFVGRFVGKAIYDGNLIDAYFTRSFYAHILGQQPSIADMESIDPAFYKSLRWMLENPIEGVLDQTFSMEVDRFGETVTVDLVPNGRNLAVTDENKEEYVHLVTAQRMTKDIQRQIDAFRSGFFEIIPQDAIAIFTEQEMELLTCGLPDIDLDDMRAHTEYRGYTVQHPVVQWFWQVVCAMDREERALLLQFVTGTSRVPIHGFAQLQGMHGPQRFALQAAPADDDRLPAAHTCFNQLDLPAYSSRAVLREKLLYAIRHGEGFGFA
jgi:E3 ubiquitin-protein ligase HUWE1